jgi:hypothetical protein
MTAAYCGYGTVFLTRFKVLMAVNIKITTFHNVMYVVWLMATIIFEKLVSSRLLVSKGKKKGKIIPVLNYYLTNLMNGPVIMGIYFMCRMVRATKMTGSSLDDWIY